MSSPLPTHSGIVAELKRAQEMLAGLPPVPREIRTHHSVPYGRCFKQWLTNGDLIIWANRGEIEDVPRRRLGPSQAPPLFGIPVRKVY